MQYLEQLKGFVQYEIAIILVLAVLATVGKSLLGLFQVEETDSGWSDDLLLAPSVGAAVLSLPLVLLAHHGVGISSRIVWSVLSILMLPLAVSKVRGFKKSKPALSDLTFHWRRWSVLPLAATVGLLPYLQLMVKPDFPAGFGTSATWQNNDLGAYIQMATNVGKSGVRDAGLVTGWNAGLQASFDHPAAHSFFAAVARILNRQPYQVGIVLMASIIATVLLGATFVIRQLSQSKQYSLIIIAVLVVMNPPVVASICNFFYPQLFSLSIVIGYIGLALIASRSTQKIWSWILLALLSASVFLISVEIAVMMIPLATIFVLANIPRIFWNQIVVKIAVAHMVVLGFFFITEFDLFKSQFNVLTKLSSSGVAGWKANFVSPSMIFGLVPNQYSGPYSSGTRLFDAFILVALFAICSIKVVHSRRNLPLVATLFSILGLVTIATQKWGIDGYQTWKLVTALTPFFMLVLLSLLLVTRNSEKSGFAIAIAMFTVGATFSWSGAIWKDAQRSSYINEDLAQVLNLEETSTQKGLNVFLAPFFETMAASVISGAPTGMISPTYQLNRGQPILYRCTITTIDKLPLLPEHGPIVAQRGQYVLVGTPTCD
jgi:hypothetical protein